MLLAPNFETFKTSVVKAEQLLKLLANQHRLQILCCLLQSEKSVGELEETLNLSQSAISQHLAKLRHSGIVSGQRRGQKIFYQLTNIEAHAILTTLYLAYCKDK
ncbi:ArsR/SmtB family transcription factor [Alteromonas flava]|uniref:ArsR/SmtB family transcription factor n=1 Tax=Alteromonas flava TaxID=2048003 RepID=UPI000C28A838|nr:metalloregulator ArsR/SmtB family transcription factor [Alteromonas flava]